MTRKELEDRVVELESENRQLVERLYSEGVYEHFKIPVLQYELTDEFGGDVVKRVAAAAKIDVNYMTSFSSQKYVYPKKVCIYILKMLGFGMTQISRIVKTERASCYSLVKIAENHVATRQLPMWAIECIDYYTKLLKTNSV